MPQNQLISVLIRTYKSAKTLNEALSGISLKHGDEIIIVDSGSTDATLHIAETYGAQIINAPRPFHYSKSLNLGFKAAKNPWVLVLSSHCIPQVPDFLEIYRTEIARFTKDVVVGYGPSTLTGKGDSRLPVDSSCFFSEKDYSEVSRICGNGNSIYRKSAWEELTFDESIRTSEDKLWIIEMMSRGYRFAYIPMARALNKSQYSLIYMFKKGCRDARTLRGPTHSPMNLWQLAGALRNMTLPKIRGEISWGNWVRYSAHTLGQFFGSYQTKDNTPIDGAS